MKHTLSMLLLLISLSLTAQELPFQKGINLTNWFQSGSAQQVQFSKYSKQDFEQIKSLGCDAIRLPINLHFMTDGAPDYTLDPLFLNFLDQAVQWAEELDLHLILDNHTFDPAVSTDPNIGTVLEKVWRQMASHYVDAYDKLYYEILNEPHGITDATWNAIQQAVVAEIRTIDTTHTIIVGGANWNSYNNLQAMPVYEDDNLIYTFHFYDPFLFTHQGASWTSPSLVPLAGIPFPYAADEMPALPNSLRDTWVGFNYNAYDQLGTVAQVKYLIDIAARFKEDRGVPVFCGEFGVYQPNSDPAQRVFWYETVRKYLEEKDIPWTIWDYHGGFGLFESGGNNLFEHDLNVDLLEALGFKIPEQSPFVLRADTVGFEIYTDFIGQGLVESSFGDGQINYYSDQTPQNGAYCLDWSDSNRYGIIGLDFQPNKDLSFLKDNGFILDLYVRGDKARTAFDIRFLDTDTADPSDHPWRMGITIDETMVTWNGAWQRLQIPLSDLQEKGAWENEWFDPRGDFDWTAIDRFEIVAEFSDFTNTTLSFDDIVIRGISTATALQQVEDAIQIFPNPTADVVLIQPAVFSNYQVRVYTQLGQLLMQQEFQDPISLDLTGYHNGVYWVQVLDGKQVVSLEKILKL